MCTERVKNSTTTDSRMPYPILRPSMDHTSTRTGPCRRDQPADHLPDAHRTVNISRRRRRSALPLALSGILASRANRLGTMWIGSRPRSQRTMSLVDSSRAGIETEQLGFAVSRGGDHDGLVDVRVARAWPPRPPRARRGSPGSLPAGPADRGAPSCPTPAARGRRCGSSAASVRSAVRQEPAVVVTGSRYPLNRCGPRTHSSPSSAGSPFSSRTRWSRNSYTGPIGTVSLDVLGHWAGSAGSVYSVHSTVSSVGPYTFSIRASGATACHARAWAER